MSTDTALIVKSPFSEPARKRTHGSSARTFLGRFAAGEEPVPDIHRPGPLQTAAPASEKVPAAAAPVVYTLGGGSDGLQLGDGATLVAGIGAAI